MKKIMILLCAVLLLAGCASEEFVFLSCDLDSGLKTLDAQFAERLSEQTVIANVFEGLVRIGENGEILPACAQKWDISANGRIYTFELRDDIFWSDGERVTADDFVFAFERMFSSTSPSPFAERYDAIKNSVAVMNGEKETESLAVTAGDGRTLTIELEKADPEFLKLLSQTPAMPCRRDFFAEQRGRYGLGVKNTVTNGAFEVYSWDGDTVKIRADSNYREKLKIDGVNFTVTDSDAAERFISGETDVYLGDSDAAGRINGEAFYDTSWALILNPDSGALSEKKVRMAIIAAADGRAEEYMPPSAVKSEGLIPPAALLGEINHRENSGSVPKAEYPGDIRGTMLSALSESEWEGVFGITLLVCEDNGGTALGASLQRAWQDELSVYINMQPTDIKSLSSRLESGSFDIAAAPITAKAGDSTLGLYNFSWLENDADCAYICGITEKAGETDTVKEASDLLFEAERRITEEYIALPLYDTPTVFALSEKVSGVYCSISSGIIYFKDAAAA